MGAGPGSTGNPIADLVLAQLAPEIRVRAEAYVHEYVEGALAEGRARLEAEAKNYGVLVENAVGTVLDRPTAVELTKAPTTGPAAKVDARSRTWRTVLQGLLATLIVGVAEAIGKSIADPAFDVTTAASWSITLSAAGTAAVAGVIAYVMRYLAPPRI